MAGCQGGGAKAGAADGVSATSPAAASATTSTAPPAQPAATPAEIPAEIPAAPSTPTAPPPAVAQQPPKPSPIPGRLGQAPAPVTPTGQARPVLIDGLQLAVPTEWIDTPAQTMRLAQMDLPGPGGFAELAVFRFPGGAGSIDQNIQRWVGQFALPDGSAPAPATRTIDLDGLKVTAVTLSGTYVAPLSPRDPSRRYNEPNWAMTCFIIEGLGDPYFFKVVGPADTLTTWQPALDALMTSFRVAA